MTRKSKANAKCPSNFDLDQGSLGKAFRSRFELDWSEAFFADVEVSSGAAGRERGRSVLPLNHDRRTSSGSFAMFAAIRRASSRVGGAF